MRITNVVSRDVKSDMKKLTAFIEPGFKVYAETLPDNQELTT